MIAYKWRISRKHLLDMAISNLETAQLNPEEEPKRELNEVNRLLSLIYSLYYM